MKKIFFRTTIILFIPMLIVISMFIIPSQYEKTYMGELKYKYERLSNTNGKRIVIIGGSAMAFGIDSELINNSFADYDVVNMGMYAAMGSRAILDLCLSKINEGDIIVFAPEQNSQTLSLYLGADFCLQGCDGAFNMLPKFFTSEENAAKILAEIPLFSYEKAKYFFTGTTPQPDSIYRQSAFNEYGDIDTILPENIMSSGYDINTQISYNNDSIDSEFIEYLNNYSRKVASKNATLLFAYAPANESAVLTTNEKDSDFAEDFLDRYHLFLNKSLDFAVIGDPHNSVLSPEWFYDTNYHLNSYGKKLYTRQLIRDLKAYLKDSSVTAIDIPNAPVLPAPNSTEEKKVLKATVYSKNTSITSITIEEDINVIEDYAFSGCSMLKEIHIKNADPSTIRIGQHLLDGTNANIYVPESSVSLYKTDYQFSLYAGRIYPD